MGNRPWPIPRSLPVCPDPARIIPCRANPRARSEEHTSELQSQSNLVCRLLLEKKKKNVLIARQPVVTLSLIAPRDSSHRRDHLSSDALPAHIRVYRIYRVVTVSVRFHVVACVA